MPDGSHFRKSDESHSPGPRRRWWPFELAALLAVALVIAVVLISQSPGHPSSRDDQRSGSSPSALAAQTDGPSPPAPAPSTTATRPATATTATTATTAARAATSTAFPVDPYLQPDGSALPVLVVFDGSTITIRGAVPSPIIATRLAALAEAYSKTPHAREVTSLVVDPRVPPSTGVRVIEMDALRFASGSSQITPQYAPGLSRVLTVMRAMPNLTALVIGHADQTGAAAQNLNLSYARATSVVEYLVSEGISSNRLTAQGVGASSLLTRQSNAAGLALNRRTEFIFYGLLTSG